jgi:hypothetical protein
VDPDIENRLTRIEKMVSDNNRMLGKLRAAQRRASAARALYWIAIIVLTIAAYYFIQPYLSAVTTGVQSTQNSFNNLKDLTGLLNGNTNQ